MTHRLVHFKNGTTSVQATESQEAMHSSIGPWTESQQVYMAPSNLNRRLNHPIQNPLVLPLVLYDVGMGLATNALAALECFWQSPRPRDLVLISFENQLEGLQTALQNEAHFPFLSQHRQTLDTLIRDGQWTSKPNLHGNKISWQLVLENFATIDLSKYPAPEVIFFDFYSPKESPELWTLNTFRRLYQACATLTEIGQETVLCTYSAATAVRSALLLAGFSVGKGAPTGLKSETTLASTQLKTLASPLDLRWLEKLARSDKPFPPDWEGSPEEGLRLVRNHLQFKT